MTLPSSYGVSVHIRRKMGNERVSEGGEAMTAFKVLLVDDETEFLETLVKRLTKRKLDVIGTTSAEKLFEY